MSDTADRALKRVRSEPSSPSSSPAPFPRLENLMGFAIFASLVVVILAFKKRSTKN